MRFIILLIFCSVLTWHSYWPESEGVTDLKYILNFSWKYFPLILLDIQAPLSQIGSFLDAYSVVKCDQHVIHRQNSAVKLPHPGNLSGITICNKNLPQKYCAWIWYENWIERFYSLLINDPLVCFKIKQIFLNSI